MIKFQTVTDGDLLKARLFNKSCQSETGCWEWKGTKRAGYGLLWHEAKTQGAHRISYEAFIGPIADDLVVRHICDNPGCINPNHLIVGTIRDNVVDREQRGRRDVKGEQIGTAKLTAAQVIEIKESDLTLKALSEKFGVDRSNIWAIRAGKSWKHLNAAQGL